MVPSRTNRKRPVLLGFVSPGPVSSTAGSVSSTAGSGFIRTSGGRTPLAGNFNWISTVSPGRRADGQGRAGPTGRRADGQRAGHGDRRKPPVVYTKVRGLGGFTLHTH